MKNIKKNKFVLTQRASVHFSFSSWLLSLLFLLVVVLMLLLLFLLRMKGSSEDSANELANIGLTFILIYIFVDCQLDEAPTNHFQRENICDFSSESSVPYDGLDRAF